VLIADSNESLPTLIQKITQATQQKNSSIIVAGEKAVIINKNQSQR